MAENILKVVLSTVNTFLYKNYSKEENKIINIEIRNIVGDYLSYTDVLEKSLSYVDLQEYLSIVNEKGTERKTKGIYYTPKDLVRFILINSAKELYGKLDNNNFSELQLKGIDYIDFCYKKTVFDPTCGSGAFLLETVQLKMDLLDSLFKNVTKNKIYKVVNTINGNDSNLDSVIITKIRILLFVLERYGSKKVEGLSKILNSNFYCYDYVELKINKNKKYDLIVGNPPYVEDSKSKSKLLKRYGNIYANVLENAACQLRKGGVLGFVIPLSYISTPRMKKIREVLYRLTPEQYILSYADRPDCLFNSVHQKLCILISKNIEKSRKIVTANYKYWYKDERPDLFNSIKTVSNDYVENDFIPKLGTNIDVSIYKKILKCNKSLMETLESGDVHLYVNMRAAFWIKAFISEHTGSEYKKFGCNTEDLACFCFCLMNSSLFWWYWICVSDCWHITKKELFNFKIPKRIDYSKGKDLADMLEKELERTKVFVGTKQTEYEYKHKECVKIINQIDDYINDLYHLTENESKYIKEFAYRYRIGGGV